MNESSERPESTEPENPSGTEKSETPEKPPEKAEPAKPKKRSRSGVRIPEKDSGLAEGSIYALSAYLLRLGLGAFCDYRIYHNDRVPKTGPAILAANHSSFLDPVVIGCGVLRRPCYLARDSLFRFPIFGPYIRAVGALPLPRESVAPRAALQLTLDVLETGRLLVLFPEGTRSANGEMGKFRRGIGWLARKSGAPVIPTRVVGTFESWPRQRILPRRFPIRVIYGKPLLCSSEESEKEFLERLRLATLELGNEEFGSEELGPSWPRPLGPLSSPASSIPSVDLKSTEIEAESGIETT